MRGGGDGGGDRWWYAVAVRGGGERAASAAAPGGRLGGPGPHHVVFGTRSAALRSLRARTTVHPLHPLARKLRCPRAHPRPPRRRLTRVAAAHRRDSLGSEASSIDRGTLRSTWWSAN